MECLAQAAGIWLLSDAPDPGRLEVHVVGIDGAKFRRPVVPGDQLRAEVDMVQLRGRTCRMKGVAYVDGNVVCEAEMMAMVVDK
jgi:3-hydroxymyristoyl/3-hydroxydecanoyl-(acyl carrier protein) dehydratase